MLQSMLEPDNLINNRYRIMRQIGRGGMGAVYEARDERLHAIVAVKQTLMTDTRLLAAFEREARLLARLRHPALVKVIDYFSEAQGSFLVMEYIPGDDLAALLQQRGAALPLDTVLDWGDQLLNAVAYIHRQNPPIIHRDIKPQNIKCTDDGDIILLDFGLAKGQLRTVADTGSITSSIYGYTPRYAPFEQIQGTGTDHRSDLYAIGATLYHVLINAAPVDALSRAGATINNQPDPLQPVAVFNPSVPDAVSQVIQQALALSPEGRYQSADAMREALQAARHGDVLLPRQAYAMPTQTAIPQHDSPTIAHTPLVDASAPTAAADTPLSGQAMPPVSPLSAASAPTVATESSVLTVGESTAAAKTLPSYEVVSSVLSSSRTTDDIAGHPPWGVLGGIALLGIGLIIAVVFLIGRPAEPYGSSGATDNVVNNAPSATIALSAVEEEAQAGDVSETFALPTPSPSPLPTPETTPTIGNDPSRYGELDKHDQVTAWSFPLPDDIDMLQTLYSGTGGSVNYRTSMSSEKIADFYRETLAPDGATEIPTLTVLEDGILSMVFENWAFAGGRKVVVQTVPLDPYTTNVNVRLEDL